MLAIQARKGPNSEPSQVVEYRILFSEVIFKLESIRPAGDRQQLQTKHTFPLCKLENGVWNFKLPIFTFPIISLKLDDIVEH